MLPVRPIDDAVVEGLETVALEIVPSMLLCPSYECGYEIGWPSNAMVIIADNDVVGTNHPPFVQLNAPQDGDVFTAPTGIALRAYAQDAEDGYNLLRKVRALGPARGGDVLALALTARAKEEDHNQALEAGYQKYLAKPIEPESPARKIRAALDG